MREMPCFTMNRDGFNFSLWGSLALGLFRQRKDCFRIGLAWPAQVVELRKCCMVEPYRDQIGAFKPVHHVMLALQIKRVGQSGVLAW
jgi:hypothetical protein